MLTRQSTFDESTRFVEVETLMDLPSCARLEQLAGFLYQKMKPYEDTLPDVERGLRYALDPERPGDGFAILAVKAGRLVGAVVFVTTQMKGYIPENILLFICVDPDLRGQGLGKRLAQRGLARCQGQISLHVEPDNPAKRLYERLGFVHKYEELRYAGGSGE